MGSIIPHAFLAKRNSILKERNSNFEEVVNISFCIHLCKMINFDAHNVYYQQYVIILFVIIISALHLNGKNLVPRHAWGKNKHYMLREAAVAAPPITRIRQSTVNFSIFPSFNQQQQQQKQTLHCFTRLRSCCKKMASLLQYSVHSHVTLAILILFILNNAVIINPVRRIIK